jgi:hypothetical protein
MILVSRVNDMFHCFRVLFNNKFTYPDIGNIPNSGEIKVDNKCPQKDIENYCIVEPAAAGSFFQILHNYLSRQTIL